MMSAAFVSAQTFREVYTPSVVFGGQPASAFITIGAPVVGSPYSLTLPLTDGDPNQFLTTDGSGTLNWVSAGTGDFVGPASSFDNAVVRFDGLTGKLGQNSALIVEDYSTSTQNKVILRPDDGATANISLVLALKGTGALMTDNPDGAATGGNARGNNAVDFQIFRSNASEVASGGGAFIGAGGANTASGANSVVVGGAGNDATNTYSFVGGGENNTNSGLWAALVGGNTNTISASEAFVGAGTSNQVSGFRASVVGGIGNLASGAHSFIGNGSGNTAAGDLTAIPGGQGLTLDAAADKSFGFLAHNGNNMTISAPGVSIFGNTDLWLANNDNTPRGLRLFEAYNTAGAFPNTANAIRIAAPASIVADYALTLPVDVGAASQVLTTDGTGTLSWTDKQILTSATDAGADAGINLSNAGVIEVTVGAATGNFNVTLAAGATGQFAYLYNNSGFQITETTTGAVIANGSGQTFAKVPNVGWKAF